jgi:SAM-dependent methyltransferase
MNVNLYQPDSAMNPELLSECQLCGGSNLVEQFVTPRVSFKKFAETGRFPQSASDLMSPIDSTIEAVGLNGEPGWTVCADCLFVFCNPRISRINQEQYYQRSGYRETSGDILLSDSDYIDEGYQRWAPHQLHRLENWLRKCGVRFEDYFDGYCLDYGCGIGGSLDFLGKHGAKTYGVELDDTLRKFGNKNYQIEILPGLKDLSEAMQWDLIFTHNAVEHVYDPNEFFNYASRTLKDSGFVVIVLPAWRYSNTPHTYGSFNCSHNSMWDHVSLSRFLNKYGMFMTAHYYGQVHAESDWEIVSVAVKSERKNNYFCDWRDFPREMDRAIPERICKRYAQRSLEAEHVHGVYEDLRTLDQRVKDEFSRFGSEEGKPDLSGLGESLAAIQQDNQQSYSVDRGLGAVALLEQRWQNAADLFRCASSRLYCDSDLRLDATFALRGASCREATILYGFLAEYKPFVWDKDVVAFARQHSLLSRGTLDLLELLC